MTKNEAASVAQGLDVAEIAKAAWDEAWRIAFSEGMSAGHPLGRSYLDCDTEWADSEVVARLAQAAPPAAPAQDAGLKAAADFIQRKADDYAREFGSDDMGSLSFGNDAMRDYHWGLLELADEIRALVAPAAPASEQDNEPRCGVCGAKTADPWLDHRGCQQLASAQQDEPMEWRIEVGGPSGYVRFETFQGVTLDDALDSAVAKNFYPAQDEDGWTRGRR